MRELLQALHLASCIALPVEILASDRYQPVFRPPLLQGKAFWASENLDTFIAVARLGPGIGMERSCQKRSSFATSDQTYSGPNLWV